jgi:hypothetical protein
MLHKETLYTLAKHAVKVKRKKVDLLGKGTLVLAAKLY